MSEADKPIQPNTDASTETDEEPKPVLLWRPGSIWRTPRNKNATAVRIDDFRNSKGGAKKTRAPDSKGKRGDDKHANRGNKPRRDKKPERIDPDSPFAKLAALKEQLKG